MLKTFLVLLLTLGIIALASDRSFFHQEDSSQPEALAASKRLRYVALGDSYTIGEGVRLRDRWPKILERNMRKEGINIRLVANPSRTGWTTKQLLEQELPYVEKHRPHFVTLLIGVNDWVQGVDEDIFRARFVEILERVPPLMTSPARVLIVTIPDYTKTPLGSQFGSPELNEAGIKRFNEIIREEAFKRDVPVVDIFALSQSESQKPGGLAEDGLHPSGQQYRAWENMILPEALKLLREW
ncbi:MAG: SGNH/GDSL hydrolase family protein [Candidatus Altimarinota bacterium]